jgi:hypothetical protein
MENSGNDNEQLSEHLFGSDAVTYNHMNEEPALKNRYITRNSILPALPFWPLVFEEIAIAAMLLILLATSL